MGRSPSMEVGADRIGEAGEAVTFEGPAQTFEHGVDLGRPAIDEAGVDLQGGGAGSYRIRLKDNHHPWDNAYPGVEVLEDGTFVVTTYGYWTEGEEPYILSVRFTLDELDRRLVER